MKRKEAKFILDKPKGNRITHIFLKFSCKDGSLRYSTQQKVLPEDWDFSFQRAKKNRQLNSELDRIHRITDHFIESKRLLGSRSIYKAELRAELDRKTDK